MSAADQKVIDGICFEKVTVTHWRVVKPDGGVMFSRRIRSAWPVTPSHRPSWPGWSAGLPEHLRRHRETQIVGCRARRHGRYLSDRLPV